MRVSENLFFSVNNSFIFTRNHFFFLRFFLCDIIVNFLVYTHKRIITVGWKFFFYYYEIDRKNNIIKFFYFYSVFFFIILPILGFLIYNFLFFYLGNLKYSLSEFVVNIEWNKILLNWKGKNEISDILENGKYFRCVCLFVCVCWK